MMKKLLSVFLLGVLLLGSASAKKWTNEVGVGFTVPVSVFGVDESGADDITQTGYGAAGTYLGFMDNGFAAKADYSIGLATTKDVDLQDSSTNLGVFLNLALGAGYKFTVTENFSLAFTGMLGLDLSVYPYAEEDVAYPHADDLKADLQEDYTYVLFSLGTDIYASYRVREHFGFFANIELRYLVAGGQSDTKVYAYKEGGADTTTTNILEGSDLAGKFRIQPTIGVVWKF